MNAGNLPAVSPIFLLSLLRAGRRARGVFRATAERHRTRTSAAARQRATRVLTASASVLTRKRGVHSEARASACVCVRLCAEGVRTRRRQGVPTAAQRMCTCTCRAEHAKMLVLQRRNVDRNVELCTEVKMHHAVPCWQRLLLNLGFTQPVAPRAPPRKVRDAPALPGQQSSEESAGQSTGRKTARSPTPPLGSIRSPTPPLPPSVPRAGGGASLWWSTRPPQEVVAKLLGQGVNAHCLEFPKADESQPWAVQTMMLAGINRDPMNALARGVNAVRCLSC